MISYIWFLLVSLNLQHAYHLNEQAECLENRINDELMGKTSLTEFVKPWAEKEDRKNWTLGKIIIGKKKKDDKWIESLREARKSAVLNNVFILHATTIDWESSNAGRFWIQGP
jgi:hypothetical protein